ncbi:MULTISPECIES: RNA-binding domain-containing protein [unclassified Haloferax]|uniref:RNA-binding domain-containing protein n=1 Tax=unclassified Haloferax TaxID=2625095 RepID=UPI002875A754|nr:MULTISPECIES: RNA-binding domain-containing protein [unclassified Haloferax]MDS0243409.1 putative DNA binding domain-containing protein [Haloferax sp. S2CR25]MDS0446530.1 putative DNA binding domain-containing protein [Haloferax sp. S2CR25-2]
MPIFEKPVDEITLGDVEQLVTEGIQEGKQIEYKEYLNLDTDSSDHKTTLLAEATSFANSNGGHLIVGIPDDDGQPEHAAGFPVDEVDQTIEQWANVLRRSTDPPLPTSSFDISAIPTEGNRHLVVVGIDRSWRSPHRVTTNDRFYARSPSGRFPLDVGEIRRRILQTERQGETFNEFRNDRIATIAGDGDRFDITTSPKFVLHVLSGDSLTPGKQIDLSTAELRTDSRPPFFEARGGAGGLDEVYSVDSVTVLRGSTDQEVSKYVRTFRGGVVEALTKYVFTTNPKHGSPYLSSSELRTALENTLPDYVSYLQRQDLRPPLYVFASIIGAPEFLIKRNSRGDEYDRVPFGEQVVTLPEVVIESYSIDPDSAIDELMDLVWNAGGKSGEPR